MSKTLRNRGTLVLPDRTYNVDYELRDGATGTLSGLSPGDMAFAMLPDESVELLLEDGRSVMIIVENQEGDFRVTEAMSQPPEPKGE